jgi:hypothetical protein
METNKKALRAGSVESSKMRLIAWEVLTRYNNTKLPKK